MEGFQKIPDGGVSEFPDGGVSEFPRKNEDTLCISSIFVTTTWTKLRQGGGTNKGPRSPATPLAAARAGLARRRSHGKAPLGQPGEYIWRGFIISPVEGFQNSPGGGV